MPFHFLFLQSYEATNIWNLWAWYWCECGLRGQEAASGMRKGGVPCYMHIFLHTIVTCHVFPGRKNKSSWLQAVVGHIRLPYWKSICLPFPRSAQLLTGRFLLPASCLNARRLHQFPIPHTFSLCFQLFLHAFRCKPQQRVTAARCGHVSDHLLTSAVFGMSCPCPRWPCVKCLARRYRRGWRCRCRYFYCCRIKTCLLTVYTWPRLL